MKVNLKFKMKALLRHVKVREFCEAKLPVEENEKGVSEANIKSKHQKQTQAEQWVPRTRVKQALLLLNSNLRQFIYIVIVIDQKTGMALSEILYFQLNCDHN